MLVYKYYTLKTMNDLCSQRYRILVFSRKPLMAEKEYTANIINLPSPWSENARKKIRKPQRQLHGFDEETLGFFQLDDIRESNIGTLLIYLSGNYGGLNVVSTGIILLIWQT